MLLVRHGQCLDNAAGVVVGQRSSSLTVLGRAQAQAAASRLAGLAAPVVFASDSRAAEMTATIIAEELGAPVRTDPALREQSAGELEGRLLGDAHARTPAAGRHLHDVSLGGGESIVQVYQRVREFFDRLAGLPAGDAVVVSHATWIQVAASYLAGDGPYEIEWADVPNGSLRAYPRPGGRGRHAASTGTP